VTKIKMPDVVLEPYTLYTRGSVATEIGAPSSLASAPRSIHHHFNCCCYYYYY